MVEITAGLLGALLGAACTFVVQRLESRRRWRFDLAQELYRTWQSIEHIEARVRAYYLLTENLRSQHPQSFLELATACRAEGRTEDWIAISRVLHFFEECGALLDCAAVDHALLKHLIGRYVTYWVDGFLHPWWELSTGRDDPRELGWHTPISRLRARVGAPQPSR
ncbi:hypothetical protein AGRA3207_005125 [Actinomadura graeca]|uniref:DUF4760 domain-containing protein n=1 Tax=Actinomadura graeca TaxID=2750812 RepID=A0ABX8QYI3_9ACTN|nr:hypothetical protein [Actinomadura graeca]QXJ23901.1 hypothetical protein AGRA3207_005125 [Actinomadura graeca]